MRDKTISSVHKWGNSLAIRIPIARKGHFQNHTRVEISLQKTCLSLRPLGKRQLTLKERLARFNPSIHGEEVMASKSVGAEVF